MVNIFEALRTDHERHRALMEAVAATSGDCPERRNGFATLRRELRAHAALEERILYSQMLAAEKSRSKAVHGISEHRKIDEILDEIADMDFANPHWLPTFRLLCVAVQHHEDEEDHGVFQLAGKAMSEENKRLLSRRYQREKATMEQA